MRSAGLFAVVALVFVLAASSFSPIARADGVFYLSKVTTNGDSTTMFEFDAGFGPGFEIIIPGGTIAQLAYAFAGDKTITEDVLDGWTLTKVECSVSVLGSTFTYITGGVIIHYVVGDSFTCTFTNSPAAPVVMPICVIRLGVEEPNGTVSWLPGYAYPGTPVSQCPDTLDGPYADVLGRMIVINQFNQTRIS